MIYAYVCRKYSGDVEQNTLEALEVAREINAIDGWIAITPHSISDGLEDTKTYEEWMRLCIKIANECDVLIVDGDASLSRGCLMERVDCVLSPQIDRHMLPAIKAQWPHVRTERRARQAYLDSFTCRPSCVDLRAMLAAIEKTEGDR